LWIGSITGLELVVTGNSASDKTAFRTPSLSAPLWALVHEDWVAHGRDWTLPGFRAVAVCRFGQWRMGIRSKALRAPFSFLYRACYRRVRNHYGIELPYTVELGRRVVFEHQSGIVIHGYSRIGDECVIRQGVTLGNRRPDEPHAAPTLLNRVNVGAGAKILGQVTIGDGAQIGANAVVLNDVPAGALAVGVPAKIVERPTNEAAFGKQNGEVAGDPFEPGSDQDAIKSVGIVVIGRNEGERLQRCLTTVAKTGCPVVYVDSGSTDGSLNRARTHGAETLELDSSQAFTAARGRNTGWRRLIELHPDLEFVQFIDGDCELAEGWLTAAVRFAKQHPDVAVVCGRRREIDPARNIYHQWTDMEWDTPVGEAAHCGGDALVRAAALVPSGGYREDLIAGEEPELCVRLRSTGWKVWRIDHEMTRHDIALHSFAQWWKRSVRSGHAYAEGAALHGAPPERHWVRESRSIWIWGAAVPIIALILAWRTNGLSIVLAAVAYLALFAKILLSRAASRMEPVASAAPFAAWCVVMKWPQAVGQAMYWYSRWRGSPPQIIEYNTSSSTKPAVNSH
jgi:serine acetyltransferase/GT2 family glycosyltransferase